MPRKEMASTVPEDIRIIFNTPDGAIAEAYSAEAVKKYEQTASRLADWLEKNAPQGLTDVDFPPAHRRRIRTTNGSERVSREIRHRTQVASIFLNEASCFTE